jgi:hypothetical protein
MRNASWSLRLLRRLAARAERRRLPSGAGRRRKGAEQARQQRYGEGARAAELSERMSHRAAGGDGVGLPERRAEAKCPSLSVESGRF